MQTIEAKLTGDTVDVYGITLRQVNPSRPASARDCIEVDGDTYYVHDFGGYWVGSREAFAVDAGDNEITSRGRRIAPEGRTGLAAPEMGEAFRIAYSDPEILVANELTHRAGCSCGSPDCPEWQRSQVGYAE